MAITITRRELVIMQAELQDLRRQYLLLEQKMGKLHDTVAYIIAKQPETPKDSRSDTIKPEEGVL